MSQPQMLKCIHTNPWYDCSLGLIVFFFFLLLLAYSIYLIVSNFKMIQYYTDKKGSVEEKDEHMKKLKEYEMLFIINMIAAFISFGVIVAFLGKVLQNNTFMKFFNKYLIIIIIIFLMVIASFNIHTYRNEVGGVNKGVKITNWVIIGLSSAIILISVSFYFLDLSIVSKPSQKPKQHQFEMATF